MLKYYFIFIGLLLFKVMILFNSLFFSFLYLITYYMLWSVFFFNFSIYVQFPCLPIQFISNLFSCYWKYGRNFRISKLYFIRDEYIFLFFYFTFYSLSSDCFLVCLLGIFFSFCFLFIFLFFFFYALLFIMFYLLIFRLLPLLLLLPMLTLTFQIILFPRPFKSKAIIAL